MAKKYASLTTLQNFLDNLKKLFATKTDVNTELAKKANSSHTHSISDTTNLQNTLDGKVSASRTINGKPLSANITLSASDVGAAPSSHNHNDTYYTQTQLDSKLANKSDTSHNHDSKYDTKGSASAVQENLDTVSDALDAHTINSDIHVTTTNKSNWNSAYTHSQAAHARVDATKVADSTTNGNILINGTETNVYSHPNSGVSVGTYKSVTVNAQGHITGGSNPTTLAGYGITDAEAKGTASSAVSSHNTSTSAHNDIRLLITNLTTKLNNFLDVDDTTTDQLSELIALIQANATDIESITSGKVNVSDIVNNLTTNVTNKPLSAAQGVAIKALIDGLQSSLNTHDANTTKHITSTERTNWNAAKTHADSAHAPSNAQPNQNAFSNIKVGTTTIAADTTTDTLTLEGSNVTITPDATNDKVTIAVANGSTSAKGIVQLTDSVSSTSTTTAATPKNVKAAYDLANTAKTTADGKANASHTHTVANITDLTATATELNYMDGVKSNVQTQLDQLKSDIDSIPQSDWGQSDSTKLDYIKNRTHWSKTESTVISEETVDTSDYTYTFATPFVLNIGQTYVVVFDGVTYDCVAFRDNGNYNRTTIGGSYSNYDTYPFSIYVKSSGDTCITSEVNSTHTVKVTNVNETIQKLDEKYIPDVFAKSADMEVMINDVEDTLSDRINKKANTSDISSGFVANVVTTLNTSNWKGVTYGNGKYVAVGDRKFAYSTDGVSWQYGTLPFYANGIAYGNGMFCAYGYSEKNVCYSTDGINWTTADTNYNSNKFSIYFLNDKFVISAGSAILSSSDCVTWSKFTLGESCTLYGGAYGNGVYIMSGYGDTFTSTNGTSWTKSTALSTTENYGSIFFVDGKFIAIAHGTTNYGSSNKIAYSTNGTSWTYGTLPKSGKWVEAAYCNGAFMVAGYQSLAYSNDGVNWEIGSLPEGWSTIETMGSGNEFLLFEGSGDEVAIARQNPFDLVFKSDSTKTLIYDSGSITTKANSISNINISGYKKIMVAVACVNDGSNVSRSGSAIFKSADGTTYQFPVWTNLFSTSTDATSSGIAQFEIMDGYLMCPYASRGIRTTNFFSDTDGGTADNLAMTGSGLLKCTKDIKYLTISSLDQSTTCSFGVGSRVIVWGCKA